MTVSRDDDDTCRCRCCCWSRRRRGPARQLDSSARRATSEDTLPPALPAAADRIAWTVAIVLQVKSCLRGLLVLWVLARFCAGCAELRGAAGRWAGASCLLAFALCPPSGFWSNGKMAHCNIIRYRYGSIAGRQGTSGLCLIINTMAWRVSRS